ncbi:hypothetical protein JW766_01575 [Candidatus Dojkabacteria bacterium]|nr:hypothetical protein [Candidatus Dojkabacteria bacterium]
MKKFLYKIKLLGVYLKILTLISVFITCFYNLANYTNVAYAQGGETLVEDDKDMVYKKLYVELPLYPEDYYYGKHLNATAAVNELNSIPPLRPGDRVQVINDGYITLNSAKGYIKPPGDFYYASGICWSVSAFGAVMDEANRKFEREYGMQLFIFNYADRIAHNDYYRTYVASNFGYGYTVVKMPDWVTDYKFTVNPELMNHQYFKNLKVKIVMVSTTDNSRGYAGQSIDGYILTNLDF